ncbi:MAG TPA: GTPase HflX, partial [Myxococcota bacterium]|nr:GTPase HflX [Myxococcota bacterium]
MVNVRPELPRVVLVGVQIDGVSDVEHAAHLAELGRLCSTLGWRVVATVTQKRQALSRGNVLGEGKLQELAKITGGTGVVGSRAPKRTSKAKEKWQADGEDDSAETAEADNAEADESDGGVETNGEQATMVVVDHELSPNQLSNLERATGVSAMDRSGVIVEIFHRHARSREARLQVEIARLNYLAPRLRESAGSSERQQGRGAGDTAVELDRRRIRDRLAELRRELDSISGDQANRRFARRDQLRVALVGYTNAGKSSLMRALTGSEVLVADQLFATLDTTVRALHPETKPRILVSDTVGFIQKLPTQLVAAFKATLEELEDAQLLLHVVDVSHPHAREHISAVYHVLEELGIEDRPALTVMNKIDRLAEANSLLRELEAEGGVAVSART